MKDKAKHPSLGSVVAVTTGIVLIYQLSFLLGVPDVVILGLAFTAMLATVWMVIRILKDPYATEKTFDDYFYQDREDLRRNGKEESQPLP